MKTWNELLKYGVSMLENNKLDDAEFEALQLILPFFDDSKDKFLLSSTMCADDAVIAEYERLLKRRISGEPLQYILGKWDFYESSFYVGKGVLIPRPETEELVARCIDIIKENNHKVVYDLCTGSGCIGLSVARACPDVQCYLFELYDDALYYADKNLKSLSLGNVTLIKLNILEGVCENIPKADLIVSNPPYIESAEIEDLQKEVLEEPLTALDGGNDGLIFYRAIYKNWSAALNERGYFAFECGENQTDAIIEIAGSSYSSEAFRDIYNNMRIVISQKL